MVYEKNEWVGSDNPHIGEPGSTPILDDWLNHLETQYDESVLYTDAAIADIPEPEPGLKVYANAAAVDAVAAAEVGVLVTSTPATFLNISDGTIAYDGFDTISIAIETLTTTSVSNPARIGRAQIARFSYDWDSAVYEYRRTKLWYDSAWLAWVLVTPSKAVLTPTVFNHTTISSMGYGNSWRLGIVRLNSPTQNPQVVQFTASGADAANVGMWTYFDITLQTQPISLTVSGAGVTLNGGTSTIAIGAGLARGFTARLTAVNTWTVSIDWNSQ